MTSFDDGTRRAECGKPMGGLCNRPHKRRTRPKQTIVQGWSWEQYPGDYTPGVLIINGQRYTIYCCRSNDAAGSAWPEAFNVESPKGFMYTVWINNGKPTCNCARARFGENSSCKHCRALVPAFAQVVNQTAMIDDADFEALCADLT